MEKTIYVKSEVQRKTAMDYLADLPIDPVHVVDIKEYKELLSGRQRRLYFKWMGEIAEKLGDDKAGMHLFYKEKYLIDIYVRDDEGFAAMYESVRNVYRAGLHTDALQIRSEIVKRTSITDANTKQMSEYLNCIDVDATMKGCVLTIPEAYDVNLGEGSRD